MSSAIESLTLVQDAIHNPAEPRHFMRIVRPGYTVSARIGETEIARSTQALKVKEVARDIYDPVLYFPRADVALHLLVRTEKSTHCPLKGDTAYFDAQIGTHRIADVGWSYERTIARAAALQDYIAFDSRRVQIIEFSAGS